MTTDSYKLYNSIIYTNVELRSLWDSADKRLALHSLKMDTELQSYLYRFYKDE